MKKPIIIANWKMKLALAESLKLAKKILKESGIRNQESGIEIVLCPSFIILSDIQKLIFKIRNSKFKIRLGAQDVFWETKGAFTGEVSAFMLKEAGCEYVIIGHSERREYLKETDEMIHKKIKVVLEEDLIPVLCVGETFGERQQGQKDFRIIMQVTKALEGIKIKPRQNLIIAYEPVWVIGSGQAVEPEEAEHTNRVIKQTLIDLFGSEIAEENFRIIYGGSVDSSTVKDFVDQPTVDGVLVGGASLDAEEFVKLITQIYTNENTE
jgi:triosephosphate isomerase